MESVSHWSADQGTTGASSCDCDECESTVNISTQYCVRKINVSPADSRMRFSNAFCLRSGRRLLLLRLTDGHSKWNAIEYKSFKHGRGQHALDKFRCVQAAQSQQVKNPNTCVRQQVPFPSHYFQPFLLFFAPKGL